MKMNDQFLTIFNPIERNYKKVIILYYNKIVWHYKNWKAYFPYKNIISFDTDICCMCKYS